MAFACGNPLLVIELNYQREAGYSAGNNNPKLFIQAESLNLLQHEATPREKNQKNPCLWRKICQNCHLFKNALDANFMTETVGSKSPLRFPQQPKRGYTEKKEKYCTILLNFSEFPLRGHGVKLDEIQYI